MKRTEEPPSWMFHQGQRASEHSKCEKLPLSGRTQVASQGNVERTRNGRLVLVMVRKPRLNSHSESDLRVVRVLGPVTRIKMAGTQAPIDVKSADESDTRLAIVTQSSSQSPLPKHIIISPSFSDVQSPSTEVGNGVLRRGTPHLKMSSKNSFNPAQQPNMKRKIVPHPPSGASPARGTKEVFSWCQLQTLSQDGVHDKGEEKRKMATKDKSFRVDKNTEPELPPTGQEPSELSSQLNQQSAMRGRRLSRQHVCQEMAAADRSFHVEENTALPPTQQPSAILSQLNQKSAARGRRLGRQEICQDRNQKTRRQGVCDESDGARDERAFIRVLNKRF